MSQCCVSMASGDVSCLAPLRVRLALVDYSCFPSVRAPLLASAARADARFYFFIVFVFVFPPPLVTRGCNSLGKGGTHMCDTFITPLLERCGKRVCVFFYSKHFGFILSVSCMGRTGG